MTNTSLQVQFNAVLDNRTNAHNTWYCLPYRENEDGTRIEDEALLSQGMEGRSIVERIVLDNMLGTIDHALSKAMAIHAESRDEVIIVPINGAALLYKNIATEFTAHCKKVPPAVLQLVIFEVVNSADESTMSFLDEIAVILYLFCLTYSCRISPATPDYTYYATCNYSAVSFWLGNRNWPLAKLSPLLTLMAQKAEKSRLKIYLHGVGSAPIRDAAAQAGIHYLDGNAIEGSI